MSGNSPGLVARKILEIESTTTYRTIDGKAFLDYRDARKHAVREALLGKGLTKESMAVLSENKAELIAFVMAELSHEELSSVSFHIKQYLDY